MPWYVIYRLNLYEDKALFQDIFEKNFNKINKNISDILLPNSINQEKKFGNLEMI